MPTSQIPDRPKAETTTKRSRLRSWRGRIALMTLLFVAISFLSTWWPRRAVWAVLIAGGSVESEGETFPLSRRIQTLEIYVPAMARPVWRRSVATATEWLQVDRKIVKVDLVQTSVDQRWLRHLKPMISLRRLQLNHRQIGPEIASLGHLSHLKNIEIFHAEMTTTLEDLLSLPNLEQLCLVNPQRAVGGFAELSNHPSLRHLYLRGESPGWSVLLEQCQGWSNVQSVSILSEDSVTRGLDVLPTCPSLRNLDIFAPLTDSDLYSLSRIGQLSLLAVSAEDRDTPFTEEGWMRLHSLKKLKHLNVAIGAANELPLDELRSMLPQCEIQIFR